MSVGMPGMLAIFLTTAIFGVVLLTLGATAGHGASYLHRSNTAGQVERVVLNNDNEATDGPAGAVALNQWLAANPNKQITSFSSELWYRDGAGAYILIWAPGNNSGQRFDVIRIDPAYGDDVVGTGELNHYLIQHTDRSLVSFAALGHYSGGIDSYVVLTNPKIVTASTTPAVQQGN